MVSLSIGFIHILRFQKQIFFLNFSFLLKRSHCLNLSCVRTCEKVFCLEPATEHMKKIIFMKAGLVSLYPSETLVTVCLSRIKRSAVVPISSHDFFIHVHHLELFIISCSKKCYFNLLDY